MTLPAPVKNFWYRASQLGEQCILTRWGLVQTDSRYPAIYDANNASVLEADPDLTLQEIQAALHPAVRRAAAKDEHIEIWETSVSSPALAAVRRLAPGQRADVVMVHEEPVVLASSGGVEVREVLEPDDDFWSWYGSLRGLFGEILSEATLRTLLERDRILFAPAGMRFFVGLLDGRRAGVVSLLSLGGVGYVDNVVTAEAYRRRGVASATVTVATLASRRAGDDTTWLLTEDGGRPMRLYERLGFRVRARVESLTRPLPAP